MNKNDFLFYFGLGLVIIGMVIDILLIRILLIILGFYISIHFHEIPSETEHKL